MSDFTDFKQPSDDVYGLYEHTHAREDGTIYTHTHSHTHEGEDGHHGHTHHGHTHTHEHTKQVLNRLARAIGHLESVKRMVEDGRDCPDVLIQLSAVTAAINNTSKIILKDHIEHCVVDAVKTGDQQELDELARAIDRLIK